MVYACRYSDDISQRRKKGASEGGERGGRRARGEARSLALASEEPEEGRAGRLIGEVGRAVPGLEPGIPCKLEKRFLHPSGRQKSVPKAGTLDHYATRPGGLRQCGFSLALARLKEPREAASGVQ